MRSGITNVDSQTERFTTAHFDDNFGFLEKNSDTIKWIEIPGGKHRDARVAVALDLVYEKFPILFENVDKDGKG